MRICVEFSETKPIIVPTHYNYFVESLIYKSLPPEMSGFLHEKGYAFGGRRFKMFTFSRLFGKFKFLSGGLAFWPPIRLFVSSPFSDFLRSLADGLLHRTHVMVGDTELKVSSIEFLKTPHLGCKVKARMLSPVTVYSTLLTAEGRKKTYYYSPYEREFGQLIEANLAKKIKLLNYREAAPHLTITPLKVSRKHERILKYKETIVKGWMGTYLLEGSAEMIRAGYEAGIGSKNPQGFGMFEVSEE